MALLNELLEKHAEELVETEPGLYASVGPVAREMVSQWPETAREHLQRMWASPSQERWAALANSPDSGQIDRFARRYFFSAAGAQAAERAARLALEAGQADLARLMLDDLAAFGPQRDRQAEPWRALRAAQSQPAAPVSAEIETQAKLAVLWQVNLTDRPTYVLNRQRRAPHWPAVPAGGAGTDLVVTQFDRHCFAFNTVSGAMAWDYYPLPTRLATRAGISGATAPRRPVIDGGRVYAVTEVPLPQDGPGTGPLAAVQALACLDAATGHPYWIRGVGEMMSREVPTILDGAPIVVGDRLYAIARTARTALYNEVFLLQVDIHTGDLLGRRHLFGLGRVEQTPAERIKPVRLGGAGGIVYIASAAGAVGAIDTNSLQPIWLRSFKPQTVTDARDADVAEVNEPNVPTSWADEPLIVDDRLVVPVDASLQVVDRWTGQALQSVGLDGPVSALAVRPGAAGQVAAVVKRNLCIVDITKGTIVQKVDLGKTPDMVGGLAPLPGGRLLICTDEQLRVLQPDGTTKNMPIGLMPAGVPLIVKDRLYIGGNGSLACVTDGEKPLAALQQEMRLSSSPLIAVRAGEVALRLDEPEAGIKALRTALERGGADASRAGDTAVRQFFDTCLTFARLYGKRQGADAQRVAEQLLEIGRQCARQPGEKIELHAAVADLQMTWKRPAEAIAAWQAILSDEALRSAPLSEPAAGQEGTPAGTWAQTRIEDAIQRHGRSAYGRFDDEAGKLLQASRWKELLERYPNSRHVPAALLRIGQQTMTKDAKGALEPLRKAVALAEADSPTQAQAMLALVRAYEQIDNLEAAATWMARLASESPDVRVERDGHTWTAAQYAADLAGRLPRQRLTVRHIDLPLQAEQSRTLDDTVSLVGTSAGVSGAGADGPMLAWSGGALRTLSSEGEEPAWREAVRTNTQPVLLAADGRQFIIHDRYRVTAIDAADGRPLWAWSARGPDPRGANVDPESVPTIQAAAAAADSVVVFTADGQAVCLDRSNGAVRWQRPAQPAYVAGLAVSGDLAAYRAGQAGKVVYRVLDVRTGRDVSLIRPPRDVPAERVEMLPAAMVMLAGTSSIEAYDAYSGTMVWQVLAKGRFRPSASLRKGSAFYIADGERHLVRIDLLTGDVAWRAVTPRQSGSSLCVLASEDRIWSVAERGAHVIDEATGKVVHTMALPAEIAPHMEIRHAAACDAGVLCLAVRRQNTDGAAPVPPAVLVLFACRDGAADVSTVAELNGATGLVSGLHVADNAVIVAAGNKVITLRGQAKASR